MLHESGYTNHGVMLIGKTFTLQYTQYTDLKYIPACTYIGESILSSKESMKVHSRVKHILLFIFFLTKHGLNFFYNMYSDIIPKKKNIYLTHSITNSKSDNYSRTA